MDILVGAAILFVSVLLGLIGARTLLWAIFFLMFRPDTHWEARDAAHALSGGLETTV